MQNTVFVLCMRCVRTDIDDDVYTVNSMWNIVYLFLLFTAPMSKQTGENIQFPGCNIPISNRFSDYLNPNK